MFVSVEQDEKTRQTNANILVLSMNFMILLMVFNANPLSFWGD